MDSLIKKYSRKLVQQKICHEGDPIFGFLDDGITWNSEHKETEVLDSVMRSLGVNSILFSPPAEPYRSILDYLSEHARDGILKPDDTETRTFLHDIPVVKKFAPEEILSALKKRKGIIAAGKGIITTGTVTPEQAFITYSSICFSCYVKFMKDFYFHAKGLHHMDGDPETLYNKAADYYSNSLRAITGSPKEKAPFNSGSDVIKAMIEAGKLTVESGMVDSFFGNISLKYNDTIYISQTGSSLDELAGCIDPCPIDNSRCNAITASSEFPAHRAVYMMTDKKTILHGHPKFSVIMSMLCDDMQCPDRGSCHIKCTVKRFIDDIPVVPGEIGTGITGLSHTMPAAMTGRGVIVWGHGLFTSGAEDFTDAFSNLVNIEKTCFEKYSRQVTGR